MPHQTLSQRYAAASAALTAGATAAVNSAVPVQAAPGESPFYTMFRTCPIEMGAMLGVQAGRLPEHECRHGRLPFDRTPPCGCFSQETPAGAEVIELPVRRAPARTRTRRAA